MNDRIDWGKAYKTYARGGASPEDIARALGRPVDEIKQYLEQEGLAQPTPEPTKPKKAPRGKDKPKKSGIDYGEKAEKDDDHGPPRSFAHAVKKAVGKHIEDEYGSGLRKLLKGGVGLAKREAVGVVARGFERNLGFTGEWIGSKIRNRAGISQVGQYAGHYTDLKAVSAKVAELDQAMEKVLSRVEYGVRGSTATIVKSIDRITSGLKNEGYKAKEAAYEETREEAVGSKKETGSAAMGVAGLAAAGAVGIGGAAMMAQPAEAAMPVPDRLVEREAQQETEKQTSDAIEFKASTIEFSADEADFGGMRIPVAYAGGASGGGGGGDGGGGGGDPGRGYNGRSRGGSAGDPGSGGGGGGRRDNGGNGEVGSKGEEHFERPTGEPGEPGTYRPARQITDDDVHDEVINTIAGEARLSDPDSVDAVINNMFNRLGSPDYPSENLRDVARAPGQYEGYRRATPEQRAMIEKRIREIGSGAHPDITNGANEFRAASYVYGEGAGKSFAREAGEKGAPNIGGNVYLDRGYEKGPYAAYPEPRFPEPKQDRVGEPRGDRRLTDPTVAGPVNAGIMAGDPDPLLDNALSARRMLETPMPQAPPDPYVQDGVDVRRFGTGADLVPNPPPPVTDYIQRTYTDLEAGKSKPQVIDAGPEPRVKAVVDGKEQTEVNPEPLSTSKKDHFDDFPGIADSGIPGLGK